MINSFLDELIKIATKAPPSGSLPTPAVQRTAMPSETPVKSPVQMLRQPAPAPAAPPAPAPDRRPAPRPVPTLAPAPQFKPSAPMSFGNRPTAPTQLAPMQQTKPLVPPQSTPRELTEQERSWINSYRRRQFDRGAQAADTPYKRAEHQQMQEQFRTGPEGFQVADTDRYGNMSKPGVGTVNPMTGKKMGLGAINQNLRNITEDGMTKMDMAVPALMGPNLIRAGGRAAAGLAGMSFGEAAPVAAKHIGKEMLHTAKHKLEYKGKQYLGKEAVGSNPGAEPAVQEAPPRRPAPTLGLSQGVRRF